MVHYKLQYFNVRGYGESIRQLFNLAGVQFEDVRYEFDYNSEEWEAAKQNTPFGQVPVLSVDGFEIPQSAAIGRYVARKFGYAGKTPEEEAWVDAIVDQLKDFFVSIRPFFVALRTGAPTEEIEKIKRETVNPAIETYFAILKKILSKSKSGFLVGDNLTWADLVVADNFTTFVAQGLVNLSNQPQLEKFYNKVNSVPALKAYLEKRAQTPL